MNKIFQWQKWPYLKELYQRHLLVIWSHALSLSLSAGIPLLTSLLSLKELFHYQPFVLKMGEIIETIERGESLSHATQQIKIFPDMFIQMLAAGEASGKLEEMLQSAGDFYQEELERKLQNLLQLLEPFIITGLGFVIGLIVIAMYWPMFKLETII